MPCAVYFTNNPFNSSFNVLYTLTFQISSGYNRLVLPQPIAVSKGNFIVLIQTIGKVAVDQSENVTYSDLVWQSPLWLSLDLNSKWRLYFNTLIDNDFNLAKFEIVHKYSSVESYQISISTNNRTLFQQQNTISLCKFNRNQSISLPL